MEFILEMALLTVNVVTFSLMGADKAFAKRSCSRIPEKTLLGWCACFGAAGGLAGMLLFHHKTRKKKFTITVPLLLLLQLAVILYLGMELSKR
jgi:uncharacterized membrane protein YsdA (DUF1294 family)